MLPSPVPQIAPSRVLAALSLDRSQTSYGLNDIAHRLGRENVRMPALVAYVRKLITGYSFPPPIAPRLYAGEIVVGARAVDIRARWHKALVDHWVDGLVPTELRLVVDNDAAAAEAAALDARAAELGGDL